MINVDLIAQAIHAGRIRISDHADEEAADDSVSMGRAVASIAAGELIEKYPDDKPYPSCLIYS